MTSQSEKKTRRLVQEKWSEWPPKLICRLFFSVKAKSSEPAIALVQESMTSKASVTEGATVDAVVAANRMWPLRRENRSRKLSARSLTTDDNDEDNVTSLCDGIDEICVQCMEVISLLSECAEDRSSPDDSDVLNLPGFANASTYSFLRGTLSCPLFRPLSIALPESHSHQTAST